VEQAIGRLFVLATPIGNLGDVSSRARLCLEKAELIATESVPSTRKLLSALQIAKPRLVSYREDSREKNEPIIVWELQQGRQVVLVSEAGTPCVSDPGYQLVARCMEAGIPIEVVPGPSALAAALSSAGLETRRVCFEGFLPGRGKERKTLLEELRHEARTLVFLEAPHRILETLADLEESLGTGRRATLLRELSKLHEERIGGTLGELRARVAAIPPRGEIVLVVAAQEQTSSAPTDVERQVSWLRAQDLSGRQIQDFLVQVLGLPRNEAYQIVHSSKTEHKFSE